MSELGLTHSVASVSSGVDDAVGVPNRKWFVAIVGNRHEKLAAERLEALGYESFVATQEEVHLWKNGRRKTVDRVLLTAIVFVRCTEAERRQTVVNLPFISRFLTNSAASSKPAAGRPVAVVPDSQIEALRFMLGHSDKPVTISSDYVKGQSVRVMRGSLRGLEGQIVSLADGSSELVVVIDALGCAKVHINPIDVEHL